MSITWQTRWMTVGRAKDRRLRGELAFPSTGPYAKKGSARARANRSIRQIVLSLFTKWRSAARGLPNLADGNLLGSV